MIITKQRIAQVNRFIDIKMGFIGAVFMGSLVFWVNVDHGAVPALIASLKQFGYTLFFGGLFLKMAENLATSMNTRLLAILAGGTIPMLITAALTLGLHSLKGTPEPFNSTVPTMIFATISFTTWSWFKTRRN